MFNVVKKSLFVLGLALSLGMGNAQADTKPAPDFTLRNLKKKEVTLSKLQGKVVLINFWATWCQPCMAEMPHLQAMYEELKDQGFEILSVSIDEARDASKVKPLIRRGKYTFPVLLDKKTQVAPLYFPDKNVPYNALVDREGNLVWSKLGYTPGEEKLIKEKVLEYLNNDKEKSSASPNTEEASTVAPNSKESTPAHLSLGISPSETL